MNVFFSEKLVKNISFHFTYKYLLSSYNALICKLRSQFRWPDKLITILRKTFLQCNQNITFLLPGENRLNLFPCIQVPVYPDFSKNFRAEKEVLKEIGHSKMGRRLWTVWYIVLHKLPKRKQIHKENYLVRLKRKLMISRSVSWT